MFVPRCGPSELLDILALRFQCSSINDELAPVLMEVDSAAEVLERADESVLHDAQKATRTERSDRVAFQAEYRERRQVLMPRPPAPKAGGKGGGRGGRGRGRGRADIAPKLPATVEHATASAFLPPNASIWRGLTRGEWCGQYGNSRRIHDKWSQWGELGSMKSVLRRLWQQYAEHMGVSFPECCEFWDRLSADPQPGPEA
jgi:hypothetical protein